MFRGRYQVIARLVFAGLIVTGPLTACGVPPAGAPETTAPPTRRAAEPATTTTRPTAPTTTTTAVTAESMQSGASLIGQAGEEVEIYDLPEDTTPSQILDAATTLGSPRVFLVEAGPVDGWIQVSLPVRPNGSTGWVHANSLDLRVLDHAIFVDLSERRLRLELANEVILETEIAVGSPSNPTPTGRYFVTDVVQLTDPTGPWGPFALGLSAFSDTISEFNGGDGIIGIHGTNRPGTIGQPVSLGCVRVPNEIAAQLAEMVELGTPVEIRA